jgi:hypothetical protein
MLMYLNECAVVELLRKVTPLLSQGGMIRCRESSVWNGTHSRQGSYQAVVRFPKLTNHFFLLRPRTPTNTPTHKGLEVPA